MAKQSKPNRSSSTPPTRVASVASVIAVPLQPNYQLNRPDNTTPNDASLRKIFWGIALVLLPILMWLSLGSGVNADDAFQTDYSEKLVKWYATMGSDTSALNIPKGNMHYYGGFFEVTSGAVNHALGHTPDYSGYQNVRHTMIALLGWLAIICLSLMIFEMAGWEAALLSLLFLAFSPGFVGQSLMNPKDMPFCAGFALAAYSMLRYFKALATAQINEKNETQNENSVVASTRLPFWQGLGGAAIGIIAGLIMAIATRAGGLLLIAYFGLFSLVDIYLRYGFKYFFQEKGLFFKYLKYGVLIVLAGYFGALLFWPYGLVSPLKHPFKALSEFEEFGIKIRILYGGDNVMSNKTPWHYAVNSIIRTIPIFALVGFGLGTVLFTRLWKRYNPIGLFILLWMAIFPVLYVTYKDSNMYNGWRHILFVYPAIVGIAALAWHYLVKELLSKWIKNQQIAKYAWIGLISLFLIEPALFMARNIRTPYLYYSPAFGGVPKAYGNYEIDYWGIGMKQGVEYLEQQGILRPDMDKPITIATNMIYALQAYIPKKYPKVTIRYVRYQNRYQQNWDYGLFTTVYIPGEQIRGGYYPMKSATIHTIDVDNVPILTVLQDTAKHAYKANMAMKQNNLPEAITEFNQEVSTHPDNEAAWADLATCYINSSDLPNAKRAIDESLKITPNNSSLYNTLGMYHLRANSAKEAISAFEKAVKLADDNATALYYLAAIHLQNKDASSALKYGLQAVEVAPNFRPAYEVCAQAYQAMGDQGTAQKYMEVARQLK